MGFFLCNGGKLERAKYFKSVFFVSSMFEKDHLVLELLSNNSLLVGQLNKDKSLGLYTRDLIFFTTDLQTVYYYSTIL